MSQPFRNIPKEYARSGRETLVATVAEADDHVWCSTVSGRLVLMKPTTKFESPRRSMTKGPSERALQNNNILCNAGDVEQFVDQSMKELRQIQCWIVGRDPWPEDMQEVHARARGNQLIRTCGQMVFHSDIHPEGQQYKLMNRLSQDLSYPVIVGMLNRELAQNTRHTVHNLMHMDSRTLGVLMSEGLNVQNLEDATQYSIHPNMRQPLTEHFEKHLGYALQANLDSDADCLVCGCNGERATPTRENLVFLEDFPKAAQEAALQHIGCDLAFYENAKNTLEAAGLEPRTTEFQSSLFKLVKDHTQGNEIEAFELPADLWAECSSENTDYETALTHAQEASQAQKEQDRDR